MCNRIWSVSGVPKFQLYPYMLPINILKIFWKSQSRPHISFFHASCSLELLFPLKKQFLSLKDWIFQVSLLNLLSNRLIWSWQNTKSTILNPWTKFDVATTCLLYFWEQQIAKKQTCFVLPINNLKRRLPKSKLVLCCTQNVAVVSIPGTEAFIISNARRQTLAPKTKQLCVYVVLTDTWKTSIVWWFFIF